MKHHLLCAIRWIMRFVTLTVAVLAATVCFLILGLTIIDPNMKQTFTVLLALQAIGVGVVTVAVIMGIIWVAVWAWDEPC